MSKHKQAMLAAALIAIVPLLVSPVQARAVHDREVTAALIRDFSLATARRPLEIVLSSRFRSEPPKKRYEVTAPIRSTVGKGLPKIAGPADARLPLVVIDAGHGGHDPGAISPHGGKREKDVTLAIAQAVRFELLKTGRVRVALTRDSDKFLVLQDRYGIARRMKADLFISIHADAAENGEASGATVYTLSEVASDREAQRLASRENKSDIINGVNLGGADANVSSILIDLTQRETMNVSAEFARLLTREARPNMRLRSNSHRFASFIVLKAPDTPSVLFEAGYLTNEDDVSFPCIRSWPAESREKYCQCHPGAFRAQADVALSEPAIGKFAIGRHQASGPLRQNG